MRTERHLLQLSSEGERWRGWYVEAMLEIRAVSRQQGWCPFRFADVLAICSPRVAVRRSVHVSLHYMRTGDWLSATIRSTKAAMRHYEETGEIRGPKTGNFAKALMGDESVFVLDTWMAKAFEIDQRLFSHMVVSAECIRRLLRVATVTGWTPTQCQAAVWAATMRRHGRRVQTLRLSEELTLWDTFNVQ